MRPRIVTHQVAPSLPSHGLQRLDLGKFRRYNAFARQSRGAHCFDEGFFPSSSGYVNAYLMALPHFKYHPDPLATGSVVSSDTVCVSCGEPRGYIYTGPVHAIDDYEGRICPWCIADGLAHEKLDAHFTDEYGVGGEPGWESVAKDIVEEVAHRTPGFEGWQQEQWWTHCGDAAEFLGKAGNRELEALGPPAILAIQDSTGLSDGPEWDEFFEALDKDGSPTAYMFRCRKCGALGGYTDCD